LGRRGLDDHIAAGRLRSVGVHADELRAPLSAAGTPPLGCARDDSRYKGAASAGMSMTLEAKIATGPSKLATLAQLGLQIVLWAAIAVAFQNSIENDVAEGAVDGPAWQFSYLRHPPLSSWVTGLAEMTGPARYWALYLAALSFACGAYYLVKRFTDRTQGAAAGWVALAGGLASPYASYWAIKFNHNIGVMPFWALTLVTAWAAFEEGSWLAWIAFGAAVGAGLWAKYALLHLVIPLALLFLVKREYRARLLGPGPWIAAFIVCLLAAPQLIDALRKGGTTFAWAVHTTPEPFAKRIEGMVYFALEALMANLPFALIAWAACGSRGLATGVRKMLSRATRSNLDVFLTVAALGPVLVIEAAGPFSVRLYYHWLTAVTVGFSAWWARAAFQSGLRAIPRRAWIVYASCVGVTAAGFVAVREIAPILSPPYSSAYGEMDAAGLDRLVDGYWREQGLPKFVYIVSLDGKPAFQAAGSLEFDSGGRARVFKDADPLNAPWLDPADVVRRGALVISTEKPAEQVRLGEVSVAIEDIRVVDRPLTRGKQKPPVLWLGVIRPRAGL